MQIAPENMLSKVPKVMEVGGSAAASTPLVSKYVFGLTPDEWSILFGAIGALFAISGFVVSWVYNHQRTKAYIAHLASVDADRPGQE